jgi:hypothetical protein
VLAGTGLAGLLILTHQVGLVPDIELSLTLVSGFVAWVTVEARGSAIATFLNAANRLRLQLILALIFTVACIGTKLLLASSNLMALMPWATTMLYVGAVLVPLGLSQKSLSERLRHGSSGNVLGASARRDSIPSVRIRN